MKLNADSRPLIYAVGGLLALGAVMVFSVLAPRGSSLSIGVWYLLKHLCWVGLGVALMALAARLDYRRLEQWRWHIAVAACLLLIVVLIPGLGTLKNGARRWLRLGPLGFQPSEAAKIAVLIVVSGLAAKMGDRMKTWRGMLPCLGVVGVASLLIILEPDFGTAVLVGGIGLTVIVVAGAPMFPIVAAGLGGMAGVAFLVWQSPARLSRVVAFLDPWKHHDAAGYQVIHSLVSLGSGGFFGRGLGASRQKLFFLPEPDTDFIFAIIGEELGFLGALLTLALFALIIRQGWRIARSAADGFGGYLAIGLSSMLALQGIMHIAVVSASMPTKGIALPFVSSGGSSLVVNMVAVGILVSIASRCAAQPAGDPSAAEAHDPAVAAPYAPDGAGATSNV